MDKTTEEAVIAAELSLLDPEIRRNPRLASALLDDGWKLRYHQGTPRS